jgi:NADH:ubiquinone oxidoreductase subunit 6 (subunit J)
MLLLVILCVIFLTAHEMRLHERADRRETAMLAETFFSAFMIVQLVLVVLLTPAVGGMARRLRAARV